MLSCLEGKPASGGVSVAVTALVDSAYCSPAYMSSNRPVVQSRAGVEFDLAAFECACVAVDIYSVGFYLHPWDSKRASRFGRAEAREGQVQASEHNT
jgi:hypothetical protein